MKKSLKMTALVLSLGMAGQVSANAIEINSPFSWTARTLEDVMSSVNKSLDSEVDYVVQWGDTLSSIATSLDMGVLDLAALNQIENPDLILAGSTLTFNPDKKTLTVNNEITYSTYTGNVIETETTGAEIIETPIVEETVATQEESEEVLLEAVQEWSDSTIESSQVEVETTAAPVVEETIAPVLETTEALVIETTIAPVLETTEAPVIETTAAPIVETTVAPVIETTAAPVVETTVAPVIEETAAPVVSSSMSPQAAFQAISAEKGLSSDQINKWSYIISRESGWNPTAQNASSGAYGLPQALPGNKMASHGADWATNPYTQLSWMYDYMVGSYGSIEGAYNQSVSRGWY